MTALKKPLEIVDYSVCSSCLNFIANAELPEDVADSESSAIETGCSSADGYFVADGASLGFSWHRCECCSGLAGERYKTVMVLYP